jgi:hypothetical protein
MHLTASMLLCVFFFNLSIIGLVKPHGLTIDYLQARNAWAQYGLAIVGFVTGAAAPMPSSYKGRWIFGPNDEVKNVFYNGALQHSVQQLYMSTGISCVLVSKVPMHR